LDGIFVNHISNLNGMEAVLPNYAASIFFKKKEKEKTQPGLKPKHPEGLFGTWRNIFCSCVLFYEIELILVPAMASFRFRFCLENGHTCRAHLGTVDGQLNIPTIR
jgi:hypothetical protein